MSIWDSILGEKILCAELKVNGTKKTVMFEEVPGLLKDCKPGDKVVIKIVAKRESELSLMREMFED